MAINLSTGWTAATLVPKTRMADEVSYAPQTPAVAPQIQPNLAPATNVVANTAVGRVIPGLNLGTANPLYAALAKILGTGSATRMPNEAAQLPANTATPTYNNATSAYQNPNIPAWMQSAVNNLNNYDSYHRDRAAAGGGGYDPLIGQTMQATEDRLAAQQKAQADADKARIAAAKAEASANDHAQHVQIQHQKYISPIGQGGGWNTPNYGGGFV